MTTGRKLIAGLLMTLFLLVSILAVCYAAVEYVLFNPGAYQSAFDESGLYETLTDYSVQFVFSQMIHAENNEMGAQLTTGLGPDGRQQLAALIFPVGYEKSQIDLLAVQLLAFLNFEHEKLTLFIDLREIRAQLNASNSQQVAHILITSWPACGLEVIGQLANLIFAPNLNNIPLCQPPEELRQPMVDVLGSLIGTAASSLPDRIDLAAGINLPDSQARQLGRFFGYYHWGRLLFRFSPLISTALLILLALVTIRPLQSLLGWSSAALLQAALIGFLNALLFWLGGRWLSNYVVQQASQTTRELSVVFGQIIETITTRMALWTLGPSVVLLLIGLVAAGGAALAAAVARRKNLKLHAK